MGSSQSYVKKVNFEDIKKCKYNNSILINTIPENNQDCLIYNTVSIDNEIKIVEDAIKNKKNIIIYGINCNDESVYKKYEQLIKLGHINVYIYLGGLFEWLLLQDIYGNEEFKTTSVLRDLLKFKPNSDIDKLLIKN